jgi:hypothetical protein
LETIGAIVAGVGSLADDSIIRPPPAYLSRAKDNRRWADHEKSNNSSRIRNCTIIGWDGKSNSCFGTTHDTVLAMEDRMNAPAKVRGTTVLID